MKWAGGSALEARAYFLLLRQKKVAKEKATPGYAVGVADYPALLAVGGGCGTRRYAAQTVLALFPPPAPLLGAAHGDSKSVRIPAPGFLIEYCGRPAKKQKNQFRPLNPDAFPGPLRGAEQRRRAGGLRLALSEPQASLASRPGCRVAQGTGRSPAPTQGRLFFAYFLLAKQKKVRRPSGRKTVHNEGPPQYSAARIESEEWHNAVQYPQRTPP